MRQETLAAGDYTCAYCGDRADQIDLTDSETRSVPCCRTCLPRLKACPSSWSKEQRQHWIDTMQIRAYRHRSRSPAITERSIKYTLPTIGSSPDDPLPRQSRLRDRLKDRNRDRS